MSIEFKVAALQGKVFIKDEAGNLRALELGQKIPPGAEIVTLEGAHVDVAELTGEAVMSIGENRGVTLDPVAQALAEIQDAPNPNAPDTSDKVVQQQSVADLDSVIAALSKGEDPFANIEETAAGTTAGSDGAEGGHSFVVVDRIVVETVPEVISTVGLASAGLQEEVRLAVPVQSIQVVPTALDDLDESVNTQKDVAKSGNVLSNATSVGGSEAVHVTQFVVDGQTKLPGETATIPGVGTLTIAADGAFVFTPATGYTGAVPAAVYTVSNGVLTNTSTLDIHVDQPSVNHAPVANPDDATVQEGVTATGNVLGNDTDADGDALNVTGFTIGSDPTVHLPGTPVTITGVGVLTLGADGAYSFVPTTGYNGSVPTITYTVSDGQGGVDTSTLSIAVTPVNDPPETADTTGTAEENQPVTLVLSGSDVDGNVDHFTISTLPSHGKLMLGTVELHVGDSVPATGNAATVTFVPDANWNGSTSFAYASVDDQGVSDASPATATITVTVPDTPPSVGTVSGDTVTEGQLNTFTVTLDHASSTPTTVTLGLVSGTATVGTDTGTTYQVSFDGGTTYTPVTGNTITVPANATGFKVQVATIDDKLVESTESYTLSARTAANTGTAPFGTANILDNDHAPIAVAGAAVVSEEGLAGGLADSAGISDTTNSPVATGTLSISDADGDALTITLTAPTTALTSAGQAIVWTGAGTNTLIGHVGSATGETAITVNVNNSGTYTVTLSKPVDHPQNSVEDVKAFGVGVAVSDGTNTTQTTLSVTVEDDMPVAVPITATLSQGGGSCNTNLLIVLDTSGSMDDASGVSGKSRFDIAKQAALDLIDRYDEMGDVKIQLVTFAENASIKGDCGWLTVAQAKSIINCMDACTTDGGTNYDAALNAAQSAYNLAGKLSGAQAVSYFLSDGAPTFGAGTTSTLGGSVNGTGYDQSGSDTGIQADEESTWKAFLNTNSIKSFAVGMGAGAVQSYLDPVAFNGATHTDADGVVVTDLSQLSTVVQSTVPTPVTGSLLGAGAGFGADGGHVASITVAGTTYNYDAAHPVLTVNTTSGTLVVNMLTGAFSITPVVNAPTLNVGFTLIDNDGDQASNTLTLQGNQPPVFGVTNATAVVSEEGLPGGIQDTAGTPVDTTNEKVASGSFHITDTDSPSVTVTLTAPTGTLTSGGQAIVWTGSGTGELIGHVGSATGAEAIKVSISSTGDYTVTLSKPIDHPTNSVEDVKSLNIAVTASDGALSSTGTLAVSIEDDMPVAVPITATVSAPTALTNLLITLDVSGSMDSASGVTGQSRFDVAKASILNLLDAYSAKGDVMVNMVIFSTSASTAGSAWMTVAQAKDLVSKMTATTTDGYTNYDAALDKAEVAFAQSGKLAGGTNVAYFFSDGEPNRGQGTTSTLTGTVNSDCSDAGIQCAEESAWKTFLSNNAIKSYAIGVSCDATVSALNPVAYDGICKTDMDGQVVTDLSKLSSVLISTVPTNPVSGSLGAFGADGGYVKSIAVGAITYTYDGSNTVTASSGSAAFNSTSHELTVSTAAGTMVVNMLTGAYTVTPTYGATGASVNFVLIDKDGDTAGSTLTLEAPKHVDLTATTTTIDASKLGLMGEYFGYNDDRTSTSNGYSCGVRLHTDDKSADYGTADNLDRLADAEKIIEGRAGNAALFGTVAMAGDSASDAKFTINEVDFGMKAGTTTDLFTNDLGQNAVTTSGGTVTSCCNNLYTFLKGADVNNVGNIVATTGVGDTTDAAIRAVGYVYMPEGHYDIRVIGDDGYSLRIGGNEVASYDGIQETTATVYADKVISGGLLPLELIYWDQAGHASLRIEIKPTGSDDTAYSPLGTSSFPLFTPGNAPTLAENQDLVEVSDGIWAVRTGATYTGTADSEDIHGTAGRDTIHGGAGNDTISGGGGNDTLWGDGGDDVFHWSNLDKGAAGAPAVDTIKDFGNGNDQLDIKDLLQGENHTSDIGNLLDYLHVEQSGTTAVIHISSSGQFAGGYAMGKEDQTIRLENYTLTGANEHDMIKNLLDNHKLSTD